MLQNPISQEPSVLKVEQNAPVAPEALKIRTHLKAGISLDEMVRLGLVTAPGYTPSSGQEGVIEGP